MRRANDSIRVAVVGGGPAGLTAAAMTARAGCDVTLFERRAEFGGQSRTEIQAGFALNRGAHAFYLGGGARRVFRDLGIRPKGVRPQSRSAIAQINQVTSTLPVGVGSLALTKLMSPREKAEFMRLSIRLILRNPDAPPDATAADWIERELTHPVNRAIFAALVRLSSYTGELDLLSADTAVAQLKIALRPGVRYLHGGWHQIVSALVDRANDLGVTLLADAHVTEVVHAGDSWIVSRDSRKAEFDKLIVAGPRDSAFALLGQHLGVPHSSHAAVAAHVAILDVGLEIDAAGRNAPNIALDLDEAKYFSVHSGPSGIAPGGCELVSAVSYARHPSDAVARESLERMLDLVRPGWASRTRMSRFLPRMTTTSALPLAATGGMPGRPSPTVDAAAGLFVAGDWVGPTGLLLNAAVDSAAAAATALVG